MEHALEILGLVVGLGQLRRLVNHVRRVANLTPRIRGWS